VAEKRGLGGEARLDGLAWHLALEQLWEIYVEAIIRHDAAGEGAEVRAGRLGETTFPLQWSDRAQRSLGSLVPDIVVRKDRSVRVVDAKYKAHLAEIDEAGWRRMGQEVRESHRADLHQVLAYAALYDADQVTASLVYPLKPATYERLRTQGRERSVAELLHGGRVVRLELRGLPFGRAA
jgi:5-methylcytosine-specific restriction endonuclease McrBC regulatory subunit McrC